MLLSEQIYLTVSSIPLFVWPLFVVLVFVGLRASKPRVMPIGLFYGLPFIGLAVLPTFFQIGLSLQTLAVFIAAYAIGASIGFHRQKELIEGFEGSRVALVGEWLTMATVMTIFFSNFVLGTLKAIQPSLVNSTIFQLGFLCIVGICSGLFLGRSLQVIKHSRSRVAIA